MTHHNRPCMALRITVLTTKGLVCHSGYQYSQLKSPVCHSGYQYSPLRALYVNQGTSTHHYGPCMSLRVPVLTTTGLVCHSGYQYSQLKSPVCHSGYQYSPLRALYVTQGTSTHHYGPCMSLRVPVLITFGLLCHSRHEYLPLHALYAIPLSDWYVTHSTSTNLYQPCMSIREQVLRSSTLV